MKEALEYQELIPIPDRPGLYTFKNLTVKDNDQVRLEAIGRLEISKNGSETIEDTVSENPQSVSPNE